MFVSVNGLSGVGTSTLVNGMVHELGCESLEVTRYLIPYSYLDLRYSYPGSEMFRLLRAAGYAFKMYRDVDCVVFEHFLLPFYNIWESDMCVKGLDFFCRFYEHEMAQSIHFWLRLDNRERMRRVADREVGSFMDVVRPEMDDDSHVDRWIEGWLDFVSGVIPNFHVLDAALSEQELVESALGLVGRG